MMKKNTYRATEQLAPEPHIEPELPTMCTEGELLSDEAKSEIFIFMMKKYLGVEKLSKMITEHASELEVYGFIYNAAEARQVVDGIMKAHCFEKRNRAIMALSMKIAARKDAAITKRYHDLQNEEKNLLAEIDEKYSREAKSLFTDLLNEFTRKAISMSGPLGSELKAIFAEIGNPN